MEDSEHVEPAIGMRDEKKGEASSIMNLWRKGLETLVLLYEIYRPRTRFFTLRLFMFFVVLNVFCYWLAISTAFPFLLVSHKAQEYFWMQIPVGCMGAFFDTASFFVTLWIARNALKSKKTWMFIFHLSLDLCIAFLATMWVVFVFIVSGWILSYLLGNPEELSERSVVYQGRLLEALLHPFEHVRNIYFGVMMGFSAGLPSFIHLFLFVQACFSFLFQRTQGIPAELESVLEEPHTEMLQDEEKTTIM